MNYEEEYSKKAIVGFDGCRYYEGKYKGVYYLADVDDIITVYSSELLVPNSQKYRGDTIQNSIWMIWRIS